VRLVQEQLQATVDSSLKVDGYFGPGTRAAVRTFQQLHDLTVDGQVGPATWALLVPEAPGTDTDHNGIVDPDEISTD
jgi:peptidoglycan hydrolase-like protein with peptidoglycan-binding domain